MSSKSKGRRTPTKWFVYKIENIVTGKVYIGKSSRPRQRFSKHKSVARKGPQYYAFKKFHASIVKHGEDNFRLEVLSEHIIEKESYESEIHFISLYKSLDPMFGYNLHYGGSEDNSRTFEKETSLRRSERQLGTKNHMFGKKHTPESRDRMS